MKEMEANLAGIYPYERRKSEYGKNLVKARNARDRDRKENGEPEAPQERYVLADSVTELLEGYATEMQAKRNPEGAHAAREMLACVKKMPANTREELLAIQKVKRYVLLEPYLERGVIGRDVYRCGLCMNVVGRHDRYCRFCGRRLAGGEAERIGPEERSDGA